MIDIQKMLNDEVEKYVSEKLSDSIQEHLASMMDKVLENVFSKWGDNALGKEVERQLKEGLKVNIGKSELLEYNGMIGNAVAQYFNTIVQERNIKPIMSIVDAVVGVPEDGEVRSFDELIGNIKEKMNDAIEDDYHRRADDVGKDYPVYAVYNKHYEWIDVFCDNEMGETKQKCSIKFSISKKTNTIFSVSNSSNSISRHFNKLESYINNLYLSQTKIQSIDRDELDDGEIELDLGSYDPY